MRLGSSYLARWCAKQNGDRESDDAANKNKPRPGNFRPPIRHEPSEVPLRSHEFSSQHRKNIKGRQRNLAQNEHRYNPDYHGDNISEIGRASCREREKEAGGGAEDKKKET